MNVLLSDNVYRGLMRHRELVWHMTVRDLKGITKGALLGRLWLIVSPLIQLAVYVAVVSFLLQGAVTDRGPFDSALYVLSGLIPWQIMAKAIQEAPSLIRDRMELIKQVIYPIETLPLTSLIVGSLSALVSLVLFLALSLIAGKVTWSFLLLPVPLAMLAAFLLGVGWTFSIAGVVFKDLREMVTMLMGLLVYLSPVILSREIVGDRIWSIVLLNPLAHVVICFRDVFRSEFHAQSWIVFGVLTVVSMTVGSWLISRTKLVINEYL